MKRFLLLLISATAYCNCFSQQLYDNGPIIDLNFNYSLQGAKWNTTSLYYYIDNTSNHLTYTERENAIVNAFNTWAANSVLTFTQVSSVNDADIKVMFRNGNHGDGNSFDGVGGILGHGFFPPPAGGSHSGELHLDDDENWSTDGTGIDLETVVLHEIGHVLGLKHSTDYNAIMYPTYHGIRRSLALDDCEGIWALYGFPFAITGSSTFCDSQMYSVQGLPTLYSVSWTFKNNAQLDSVLQQNYPGINQCVVNAGNLQLLDEVLTARIYKNGSLKTTIEKSVFSGSDFHGVYSQQGAYYHYKNYPSISETGFDEFDIINVNPGCLVTVQSPHFKYATVTTQINQSNCSFLLWNYDGNETITFMLPFRTEGVTVGVHGADVNGKTCNNFNFIIHCSSDTGILPMLSMNIEKKKENIYEVTMTETIIESFESTPVDEWDLEVRHSLTGEMKCQKHCSGFSESFDSSHWPSGVYLVRGKTKNMEVVNKIVIRNQF